jgi:hypothetical protein
VGQLRTARPINTRLPALLQDQIINKLLLLNYEREFCQRK